MTFSGRRILVVDNDFLVSLTTTDLLESSGCDVVGPAACVATALEFARSEALDAAVLDIDIGGELVWPVASELQRRGVPVLFLSVPIPQMMFPAQFAAAPRLNKPLVHHRLVNHLDTIWSVSAAKVAPSRTPRLRTRVISSLTVPAC